MTLAAGQARIMLPPVVYNMQLKKVEVQGRVRCTFANVLGREDMITCDLLVTAHDLGVSTGLFRCLNDSAIVYDGGLVVDSGFRTNDPSIYAAGQTCTKFSRRYGQGARMDMVNQKELGRHLKCSVAAGVGGGRRARSRTPSQTSTHPWSFRRNSAGATPSPSWGCPRRSGR